MSAPATISGNGPVGSTGADTAVHSVGSPKRLTAAPGQWTIAVWFRSSDARESCPDDTNWTAVTWSDLHGD